MPPDYEVGVLFVHGIGQQKRGETLVGFGEPLYEWFRRRFEHLRGKWIEEYRVTDREVSEWLERVRGRWTREGKAAQATDWAEAIRPLKDGARAHAKGENVRQIESIVAEAASRSVCGRVDLRQLPGANPYPSQVLQILLIDHAGGVSESQWLLAESWWAEEFHSPRFSELAEWGLRAIPWTINSHFGTRVRRSWRVLTAQERPLPLVAASFRLLGAVALHVASALLAVVLVAAALSLMLLSLLPLPYVASFVRRVQRRLCAFLGDCYAFVARPAQRAAIVGRVREDMQWLATKCLKVAVVAHSQGGAVSHLALREGLPDRVKLLWTFGSGLRKLEDLQSVSARRLSWAAVFFLLSPLLFAAAFGPFGLGNVWRWLAGLLGLASFIAGSSGAVSGVGTEGLKHWARTWRGLVWKDCYATGDPVPNGPLFDDDKDLVSVQVHNRGSFVRDHTTYWNNTDEFVSAVACEVSRLTTVDPVKTLVPDVYTLKKVAAQRGQRVKWLGVARAVVLLTGTAVVVARCGELPSLTRWVVSVLPDTTGPSIESTLVAPFVDLLQWVRTGGARAVGLILSFATVQAVSKVVFLCWRAWDASDTAAFLNGEVYNRQWLGRTVFGFCGTLVLGLGTVAALLGGLRDVTWLVGAVIAAGLGALVVNISHRGWLAVRGRVDKANREYDKLPKMNLPR